MLLVTTTHQDQLSVTSFVLQKCEMEKAAGRETAPDLDTFEIGLQVVVKTAVVGAALQMDLT